MDTPMMTAASRKAFACHALQQNKKHRYFIFQPPCSALSAPVAAARHTAM